MSRDMRGEEITDDMYNAAMTEEEIRERRARKILEAMRPEDVVDEYGDYDAIFEWLMDYHYFDILEKIEDEIDKGLHD